MVLKGHGVNASTRIGLGASVLLHALAVFAMFVLPARESPPERSPEAPAVVVELVSLEPPRPRPTAPPTDGRVEVPEAEPARSVAGSKSATPRRRRRSGASGRGLASENGGVEGPAGESGPGAGGLRLRGLRGASTDATPGRAGSSSSGAARPQLSFPTPSEPLDRPPTLSDMGFSQRKGADLVRDDPSLPFVATIHADGRLSFRKRVGFPYAYYRQKTKVQKETFALRVKLARSWAKREMKRRLLSLPRELEGVWRGGGSAKSRRTLLFELWDECLESSADRGEVEDIDAALDRERGRMGERARAQIVGFIARELPPGSADGYSPAELRALNQRRASRQRFAPYGGSPARGKAQ